MIRVLFGQDFDTAATFVDALNKARLANKQRWIVYLGTVANRTIELKTFDHGDLQILRVDGVNHAGPSYGLNVGAWKAAIRRAVEYKAP